MMVHLCIFLLVLERASVTNFVTKNWNLNYFMLREEKSSDGKV